MGRRVFGATAAAMLGLCLTASLRDAHAQSYGYQRDQDPLVPNTKEAIRRARDGEWEKLDDALAALGPAIEETKKTLGVDLTTKLESARKAKDARLFAYALVELSFQSLRIKLASNLRDELKNGVAARVRIDSVAIYYEEILAHAVRRADETQKQTRHKQIVDTLDELKRSVGSAGLFGLGERQPNVARARELSAQLERVLREVFTDFEVGGAAPPVAPPGIPPSGTPPPSRPAGERR
ncbi:MAG: hypothetical protein ACKVX7_09375 [Planctomycetota bacterium]